MGGREGGLPSVPADIFRHLVRKSFVFKNEYADLEQQKGEDAEQEEKPDHKT